MKLTKAMAEKIFSAKDYEEAKRNAAEVGYELSEKEDAELKKHFTHELSDDELDAVAGGEISWGSKGKVSCAADVVYEFNVGDRVEVYFSWFFHAFTNRATIRERMVENEGSSYRPIYKVEYDKPVICRYTDGTMKGEWVDQDYLSY